MGIEEGYPVGKHVGFGVGREVFTALIAKGDKEGMLEGDDVIGEIEGETEGRTDG